MELLKDPNVWIDNTKASCNSTGSYIRMVSKKVTYKSDGVTLPDGQVKGMSMIGNVPGVICNKNGTKQYGCKITEVEYCKDNVIISLILPKDKRMD
eukprot:13992198-Ditylum_brightwellii.AAC.1